MTPEQLKASILQYAIQGKLVEQRPEEGTGEELYRQIQAEKQRLIKEGKIKKEKALPEIAEDEIPFDLPDSWKWVRLNAVIVLLSGSDLTPNKYNNSCKGIPYITGASNIEGEKLVINRWTEYPNNIAHNGDLLLTCKGTVGKTTILNEPEVHIARQLMAITAIELNLKYLKYFVESHVDVLKAKAKSLIPGIERDNVLKLLLPLPPLAEQHRIVAKIEELLPYVDRYAAAYEKLEQFNAKFPEDMKKSILQYAIQGKLVEQRPEEGTGKELYRQIQEEKKRLIKEGTIKKEKPLAEIAEDEIPFDIPENWKWVQLGNLASINGGFAFKSTNYRNVGDSPAINVSQLKFLYPLKTLVFPAFSPPRFGPFPSFFPLREEMRETFFRPSLQPYPTALRKFAWPLWWRGRKCSLWYLHQNVPAAPAHPWVRLREREGWSYMYVSTDGSENHPYPRSSFGNIGIRC